MAAWTARAAADNAGEPGMAFEIGEAQLREWLGLGKGETLQRARVKVSSAGRPYAIEVVFGSDERSKTGPRPGEQGVSYLQRLHERGIQIGDGNSQTNVF